LKVKILVKHFFNKGDPYTETANGVVFCKLFNNLGIRCHEAKLS